MFASVKKAGAWFLDGLTEAAAGALDRLNKRAPIRLVDLGDGAFALEQPGGKRERARLKLVQAGDKAQLQPAETAKQLADRDVDIVLPSDELLVRTLDPLPAESRQYLDGIVRHQLERVVPWRADNVLYSYDVATAGPGDDRLVVRVAATARTLHASVIDAANALAPLKVRLLYRGARQDGGDVAIDVADSAAGTQMQRLRLGIAGALAVLVLLSAVAVGYLSYSWQEATDALAAAEQSEANLRKQLGGRGAQETAATRDLRGILARKQSQPPVVLALEALSNALPDDTWLTELQLAEGQLRVSGVSGSVADLVPAVQGADIFADATFFSPTTRLANGDGDRFHLQMRLVAPGTAGK